MMTAAVRDLHLAHPDEFLTDVRTTAGQLWENNPYLTPLSDDEPGVEVVPMRYDLIHESNEGAYHFIHGYARHLERALGVRIPVTRFRGDLHVSDLEKSWMSQVEEDPICWGDEFWILVAGGKYDYTAMWCCDNGGGWKSRCVPLNDGDEKDRPENLCVEPVTVGPDRSIPRCLDLITAGDVIRAIELYHAGGALGYLSGPAHR